MLLYLRSTEEQLFKKTIIWEEISYLLFQSSFMSYERRLYKQISSCMNHFTKKPHKIYWNTDNPLFSNNHKYSGMWILWWNIFRMSYFCWLNFQKYNKANWCRHSDYDSRRAALPFNRKSIFVLCLTCLIFFKCGFIKWFPKPDLPTR